MEINLYGFLIGVGAIGSLAVVTKLYEEKGGKGEIIGEAFWWVVIPGLIGARVYHVVDQIDYYILNIGQIFQLWMGGMGIFGGIGGGVLGLIAFSILHAMREEKIAEEVFFSLSDLLAMAAALAQAIGRWGNYFNKELYGKATTLPWGINIEGMPGKYHPLFLYESILDVVLFIILIAMYGRGYKRGSVFGSYLIGYGVIRLALEWMRVESWVIGGVTVAHLMSVLLILSGVLVLSRRRKYIVEI